MDGEELSSRFSNPLHAQMSNRGLGIVMLQDDLLLP
jgi:hypothetical protein